MVTILVMILLLASIGAHAVANTIQHEAYDPNNISPTSALLIRIRLSSLSDVLASKEFQSRAAKREAPLREFGRIRGAKLEAIQKL